MSSWRHLQDSAALEMEPWRHAHWILNELDIGQLQSMLQLHSMPVHPSKLQCITNLRESKRARGALRQASIAAAILAVTFRLQLIVLGRLPAEAAAAPPPQQPSGSKRAAPAPSEAAPPLYSIRRFGPHDPASASAPPAAPPGAPPSKQQKGSAQPPCATPTPAPLWQPSDMTALHRVLSGHCRVYFLAGCPPPEAGFSFRSRGRQTSAAVAACWWLPCFACLQMRCVGPVTVEPLCALTKYDISMLRKRQL